MQKFIFSTFPDHEIEKEGKSYILRKKNEEGLFTGSLEECIIKLVRIFNNKLNEEQFQELKAFSSWTLRPEMITLDLSLNVSENGENEEP